MGVNRLGRSHLVWPLNARNPQVGIPDLRVSRLCACVERCCCYITRSGSLAVAFASNLLLVGYTGGFLEQLAVGVAQPAVGHHGVGVALRAVVHAGAVSLVARGALLLAMLRRVRLILPIHAVFFSSSSRV